MLSFNTPIPFYDMPVSCGNPTMTGDVTPVMIMMPDEVLGPYSVYCTRAEGDSMKDLGIMTGDMLIIECAPEYNSGDIVVAEIDGEKTLKTYFVDENGEQWLVPANSRYSARRLTSGMQVTFRGRLKNHIRQAPRDSMRHIMECIREAEPVQEEASIPQELATQEAMRLLESARNMGWLDEQYHPRISRTMSAVLADHIAELLNIGQKWKVFEAFWHRRNMRGDYNDALEQKQYGMFYEKMNKTIYL